MYATRCTSTLALLSGAIMLSASVGATDPGAGSGSKPDATAKPLAPLVYIPPQRGTPTNRVGGGTRSAGQFTVLSPPHLAFTSRSQPRLYWYVQPGFRNKQRFRIARTGEAPPLLEIALPPMFNGGIGHLDLASHSVVLEPGQVYEWGVLLEPEVHERWPAMVSTGLIGVEKPDPVVYSARMDQRPFLAAQRGLWHDALDSISRLIEMQPEAANHWRALRADLLQQAGLDTAARHDRRKLLGPQ